MSSSTEAAKRENAVEMANGTHSTHQPVQLTDEQFERLLGARSAGSHSGHHFADPTPLGLQGFLLALTPASICLMRWGHMTPLSLVTLVPLFYLMGGVSLWVAAIMSFVIGQTFSMITFGGFGSFMFTLGMSLQPSEAIAFAAGGLTDPGYNDALATYFLAFAVFCLFLSLGGIRVNFGFFFVCFTVTIGLVLLGVGYARNARSDTEQALKLFRAAGAFFFVCCVGGWYLLLNHVLINVHYGFQLPVGSLVRKPKADQ